MRRAWRSRVKEANNSIYSVRHWLYEWFSQFHSCGTYSVLSLSPSLVYYPRSHGLLLTLCGSVIRMLTHDQQIVGSTLAFGSDPVQVVHPRTSATSFLTRTFRNVFYIRVGKRCVRLWRSRRLWAVVWGGSRRDGSWKRPAGAGATPTVAASAGAADTSPARSGHAPKPEVEPATPAGVILPETGQFLLLCLLQLWQQLQRCRQIHARMQVFWRIILPFYGNSSPGTTRFLGKRTVLVLRNSRL